MRVQILNYDAYGVGEMFKYMEEFPVGSIHEVYEFFPDTGEVDLGDAEEEVTFAPSEYRVVGDWEQV